MSSNTGIEFFISKLFGIYIVLLCASSYQANTTEDECSSLHSCTSKECIRHTEAFYNNMKLNMDPCIDFYDFSCRGYADRFGKEDTQTAHDDMWLSLLKTIKDLLEKIQVETNTASGKMKKMYDACVDMGTTELTSVPDALQFISDIGILGWPVLNQNFVLNFTNLSELLGKLAAHGEFAFIKFQSSPYGENDARTNGSSIALLLPDYYIFDSKLKPKDIENSIFKILKKLKFDHNAAFNILENVKAIENISIKLQNERSEYSARCTHDATRGYVKLNCSEEMDDNLKFLCSFWKSAVNYGNLAQHFSNDTLHISCRWNHYHYMENIFSTVQSFSPKSIADYLALRFFFSHLDDMNLHFQLIKKAYSSVKDSKHKTKDLIDRWQYCIGWIIKSMSFALGFEYTNNIITEHQQNEIITIIKDYIRELRNILSRQNWINENAKVFLTKQIGKLKTGFKTTMANYRNSTFAENYYKEFEPTRGSFLKNILEYKRSLMHKLIKIDTTFNSFYGTSDSDKLDFGYSLLYPPAYSPGLPEAWNYATIGWIISHELIHNLQLLFDLGPVDSETGSKFLNKTGCYVSEYMQIVAARTGKRVLSTETKEEIIADNIAWELTERVIRKKFNMTDVVLPSFKYNSQQLIFLSFGQICCATLSKNIEKELYYTKPHDIQKLRLTTVLRNSKTFSRTFECPLHSPMNPEEKCTFFE